MVLYWAQSVRVVTTHLALRHHIWHHHSTPGTTTSHLAPQHTWHHNIISDIWHHNIMYGATAHLAPQHSWHHSTPNISWLRHCNQTFSSHNS